MAIKILTNAAEVTAIQAAIDLVDDAILFADLVGGVYEHDTDHAQFYTSIDIDAIIAANTASPDYNSYIGSLGFKNNSSQSSVNNELSETEIKDLLESKYDTADFPTDFTTQLGTKTSDDIAEGAANLYLTSANLDTLLATKDTDGLSEGSANLYHTAARAIAAVGGSINDAGTTTSDLFSASKIIADLAGKANSTHTHTLSDITDYVPGSFAPTVHTHVEADITDLDKYTVAATDALLLLKANVAHTHVKADITDFSDGDYATAVHTHVVADITDFDPTDYSLATHTHTESDITDLDKYSVAAADALLATKADVGHTHTLADITDVSSFSTLGHTHVEADITDLDKYTQAQVDAALLLKANATHTHTKADITDFVEGDYATAAHTHTLADITDSGTAAGLDFGTAANQIVKLDGSGALPAVDGSNLTGVIVDYSNLTGTPTLPTDTDGLPEGSTNLYYTQARFDAALAAKTTDDLAEGTTNKYITAAQEAKLDDIIITNPIDLDALDAASHTHANQAILDAITESYTTADKNKIDFLTVTAPINLDTIATDSHTHANKALLDTYTQTEADLANAVALAHTHANQAILDAIDVAYTTVINDKINLIGVSAAIDLDALSTSVTTNATDIATLSTSISTINTDTVAVATEVDNLLLALGVASNDADMGLYTSPSVPDSSSQFAINEALGGLIDGISGGAADAVALRTMSGTTTGDTNLGAAIGTTVTAGATTLSALGEIVTAHEAFVAQKAAASGLAPLDASSKIPTAYLPDLSISEFLGNFTDTTTALADAGVMASQRGDWFTVDTNGGESYIVTTDAPTVIGSVTALKTPTDAVTSVNGQTGTVVLGATNIGATAQTNYATSTDVQAQLGELDTQLKTTTDSLGTSAADIADLLSVLGVADGDTAMTDTGGYYTAGDIEAILQEIGATNATQTTNISTNTTNIATNTTNITANDGDITDIRSYLGIGDGVTALADAGGYYTGTDVETALQEIGASFAALDHDTLTNFVANEHIDHTAVSVLATTNPGIVVANNNLSANIGAYLDLGQLTTEDGVDVANDRIGYWDKDGLDTKNRQTLIQNITTFDINANTGSGSIIPTINTLSITGVGTQGVVTSVTGGDTVTVGWLSSQFATDTTILDADEINFLDAVDGTQKNMTYANWKTTMKSDISDILDISNLTTDTASALTDVLAIDDGSAANKKITYQNFFNSTSNLADTASTAFTDKLMLLAGGSTAQLIERKDLITQRTAWVTGTTAISTWNNTTETTYNSWSTSTALSASLDTSALTVSANGIFTVARGYYLVEIYAQGTGTGNTTSPVIAFSEDVDAIASTPLFTVPKQNNDNNTSGIDGWAGSAVGTLRLNSGNQYTIKGIRNHGAGTWTNTKFIMRLTLLQEI